jgi:predicted amidohydrolase YtcJ
MRKLTFALYLLLIDPQVVSYASGPEMADRAYRNGVLFTAEDGKATAQALAVRDGRIIYVGSNDGVIQYIGSNTRVVDLNGRFMMPGIEDGHIHPMNYGRASLQHCDLKQQALNIAQFQERIQKCLDATRDREPDGWLQVSNAFLEIMRPLGVWPSRAALDALQTRRPIFVPSPQGHDALVNSRALALAHITAATPDPVAGTLSRDAKGEPTGMLHEASAMELVRRVIPPLTPEQEAAAARAALDAMRRQGITSFLEAVSTEESIAAFDSVRRAGGLTARAHFAPRITPAEAKAAPDVAVSRVTKIRAQYDTGAMSASPGITVRNAKLFLDGDIYAPSFTGAMLEPYWENVGTAMAPVWKPGTNRGPVNFPPEVLANLLVLLGRNGIDPHMHADGDQAVRWALDGIAHLRAALPTADIRPAVAHDEIVSPLDYPRFKALNAIPVLGFQWQRPMLVTTGVLKDYFGPARMKLMEPAGVLEAAGARIALGSDWPVDELNEWFAFKVAVTRTGAPDAPPEYRGRLGDDPGLSPDAVLRAATINTAYQLHDDDVVGSLKAGKWADLIVLDRNPLTIPADDIANVRVVETVVGGRVVYFAPELE